ncbi:C-C motif chemokine 22 [Prionailurus viverrinus]|uniref:C-C motif chemokine n=2 Tax=Felinae TaxID=338152 RepID=A0ABI7VVY8_FELCA|nr:C-C motif chemokine 22 [Felis catus]XP_030155445.1 C-C motif chemokine 22 isoform X2 [Lynx canadensis]XP_043455210.1 C-C motif chemokine 22 [Prionailurus bengalensis]XP_046935176.1 C-C motif chemokine 22 isoform X2 [Lynx rufus]XP_047691981.1 C-C motif chemokine 22 [Prionailurus viverrinus]
MASPKILFLAVLVLLAMTLQATEAGPYGANVEDSVCCRDYFRHPLPSRMLKYFYWTSDSCRRPGVVFLTVRDREICADPRLPWVKKILQKMNP